ncbi:Hypothetical protein, putative [Bodo saltans]|uniref:Fe2OG dioxygenase domain-containing protein n=1 Tax=Bodo saltans TaxID=75058 RepID=A0A0S4IS46_BODSA|nr:Hypothetical protein, putative [Bodo saltans]|eukprot:CUF19176.1 Hypothetical protein, putative [Bodo saltans]
MSDEHIRHAASNVSLVEAKDAVVEASYQTCHLPLLTVSLSSRRLDKCDASPHHAEQPRVVYLDEQQYGSRAVVVRSVLTPEECVACIEFMKQSDMVPAHTRTDYANNMRILVRSKDFAEEVYQRLLPTLAILHEEEKSVTSENAEAFPDNGLGMTGTWRAECLNDCFRMCCYHPGGHFVCYQLWNSCAKRRSQSENAKAYPDNGLGMTGTWRAECLNDCFRMCCYHPGGHFAPHYDADYVVDAVSYRSFKTMMIYLNDEYVGGETNFVAEHSLYWDEERKLYCAPKETIVASFKASPGDVLLFDHKILHEGAQVQSGMKWMMRSEIMYRKCGSDQGEGLTDVDAKLAEALQILQLAKNAEGSGDMTLAVKLYSKAFKLYPELERHA